MEKAYKRSGDRIARVTHLRRIYCILREKQVPNVDELSLSFLDDPHRGSVVYLRPKGVAARPANAREVLDAVLCVLSALKARSFWIMMLIYVD